MRFHHLTTRLLGPLVLATTMIACVEESPVENLSISPQWTVATLPEDSIEEHPEMLRIAKEVPEFAGFYFDPSGQLVVAVTDPTKSSAAEARVREGLGTHQTARGVVNASTVRLVSQQVQYSFLQLARYRTVLRGYVFGIPGVVLLGVDEAANRVHIGITAASVEREVRELLGKLDIPDQAVTFVTITKRPTPMTQLTDRHPNGFIQGGWQIGRSGGTCTLGFAARRVSNGQPVFVSNSHCTSIEHNPDSTAQHQPTYPSWPVGYEIQDVSFWTCTFFGYPTFCAHADAALFSAETTIQLGTIARPTTSSGCDDCLSGLTVDTANPLQITSARSFAIMGETLHKVGRTSGWTYGPVMDTCDDAINGWVRQCTDRVDFSMHDGDSGSPVFKVKGDGTVELVGVAWGTIGFWWDGDALISNLGQITKGLGGLTVYDPGAPTVTIGGPTEVPQGALCTWDANVSGGVPPFTYQWSGLLSGSNLSVTGNVNSSGQLQVVVTDFFSRQGSNWINVNVEQLPPLCPM